MLEDAVRLPATPTKEPLRWEHRTGQAFIDAFEEIQGLLTDQEIDWMFARNSSPARFVDLS